MPFYLRTGKRMSERVAEIVVYFRAVPHSIFPSTGTDPHGNRLEIQLQPEEELKLFMMAKVPGDTMNLKPVGLNLDFAEQFKQRPMEAYERLLLDAIRGNLTLFHAPRRTGCRMVLVRAHSGRLTSHRPGTQAV